MVVLLAAEAARQTKAEMYEAMRDAQTTKQAMDILWQNSPEEAHEN